MAFAIGAVFRHDASALRAEWAPVFSQYHRVGALGVGERQQVRKDVELVLEHSVDEACYLFGFHRKKAFGQPTVADSIAKPSPGWLNKGILRSAGVCLGILVWHAYFTPKDGAISVDM